MTITNETVEKMVKSLSIKAIYNCDLCGKRDEIDKELMISLPLGWSEIFSCYGLSTGIHLCPECTPSKKNDTSST